MKKYKVKLEVFDGKPITERTGKSIVLGVSSRKPFEGDYYPVMYENEDCESPGVCVEVNELRQEDNCFYFKSKEKRDYKLTILNL